MKRMLTVQMRILDDILTLSKMDSISFTIEPIQNQPKKLIHDNLKIFQSEAARRSVDLSYTVCIMS